MRYLQATLPEPRSDVLAQLNCLRGSSPKSAVFISRHNDPESFPVPPGCYIGERDEGVLICRSEDVAEWFSSAPSISDEDMASVLGYPQSKAVSMSHGCPVVVQVRDANNSVIQECSVDAYDLHLSVASLWPYVGNGSMNFSTVKAVIDRRLQLQRNCNGS